MASLRMSVPIFIEYDDDVAKTLEMARRVANVVAFVGYNHGDPITSATELQRKVYGLVKGALSSRMTITIIQQVAGTYAHVKNMGETIDQPLGYTKKIAVFMIGKQGRDARIQRDGTLSIWTVKGRKQLRYCLYDQELFERATSFRNLVIEENQGRLIGQLGFEYRPRWELR